MHPKMETKQKKRSSLFQSFGSSPKMHRANAMAELKIENVNNLCQCVIRMHFHFPQHLFSMDDFVRYRYRIAIKVNSAGIFKNRTSLTQSAEREKGEEVVE